MWRYWWSYPDELRFLRGYDAVFNEVKSAQTTGSFEDELNVQDKKLNKLEIPGVDDNSPGSISDMNFHTMLSQSINGLSGFSRKVMLAEVAKTSNDDRDCAKALSA